MSTRKVDSDSIFIRSTYSPKYVVNVSFFSPSLTHQSFKDDCDIDKILKRYARTGVLEHVNTYKFDYADFLNVQDYHSSFNQVLNAQSMFMSLPAQIRSRFSNDPGLFLAFVQDPTNHNDLVSMGLAKSTAQSSSSGESQPSAEGS